MSEQKKLGMPATLLIWGAAFVAVLVAFYGLDQMIMSIQGLPLNVDLTPAG
ncbi:hypothetical protein [Candidatus Endoriftia persephone]|jgi:hypothetical protein|uniref:Uncharacterized protein n=2 Tax=Gammaproteobacteria TaxID=1236 RepID=G2FCD5_9GAMM|nr:hypothetical protein [Candidatus Endoriftia persephone]EGW55498.1 hypothetical protein TevJSym_ac00610 [endosymbiont of Tevnia jerichonana (vent Tica)]USF86650.1 hypothetical protein L0Y14_10935 [Candidatus Endoriftia persephone]